MAMLTKSFEIIQLGNRSDVCVLCIKKEKGNLSQRRTILRGKLENKKVVRHNTEECYCLECLSTIVDEYKSSIAEVEEEVK